MNETPVIHTSQLTKRYGDRITAVDHLDLEVCQGEVFGFLGPNGAGKTTTLRMLLGLIKPTSGTALVAGYRPGQPEGLRRVGSLVEAPAFYPYLTGRENLKVVADYAGVPYSGIDGALEEVDLLGRGRDRFATYSMGMKQRLAVAAAMIKQPQLMILDEPTNGLDPQGMAEMRKLIEDIAQGGRTVLISSHLLGEIEQVCDRVGVISNGRLIRQSTVQELVGGEEGVLVRAHPVERAQDLLTRMFGTELVARQDGVLQLATKSTESMEINRLLTSAGIGVSELRPIERSLEEVFFQLTGEKQGS
jgi:ABC-2 type transport system ATP-binding protein